MFVLSPAWRAAASRQWRLELKGRREKERGANAETFERLPNYGSYLTTLPVGLNKFGRVARSRTHFIELFY